jgi:glycosyltransferase involved in cell wall biosynthesis
MPTRDRAASLARAAAAVLADPALDELVVVDDGSVDGTREVLESLVDGDARVRPVSLDGRGAAVARQAGVEAATAEIVLLLDDDVVAGPGLAAGHARRHSADDPALVVVGYMPTRRPPPGARGRFATTLYADEYDAHVARYERDPSTILEALWAGNVSLHRSTCLAVGVAAGLPAVNHNDREFGLRLLRHGAHAVFDRSLLATHDHDRPLDSFLADARRQGAGRALIHSMHGDLVGPFSPDDLSADLPAPLRRLVRWTDDERARRGVLRAGQAAISAAGTARLARVELAVARLLRRVELRHGARHAPADRL